ncbi:hypothetical protein AX14_003148 [Amanita brunnescens Koide BX004]|nr:hypothetical protein AX14_003148 [Amanita brunnescens Koide BX004]
MPLRTGQDAPCFCSDTDDLARYIEEVEGLCHSRQRTSGAELIKFTVYYTDELSYDAFSAARDALADPTSWDEFKQAMHEVYPQHKGQAIAVSLPASLPPLPVPSASLPSLLPATPVTPLVPQFPAPTVMLTQAALQALSRPAPSKLPAIPAMSLSSASDTQALLPPALPLSLPLFFPPDMSPAPVLLNASLLSSAPLNMPKVPVLPQLLPAAAPPSPVQVCLLCTPAPAPRLVFQSSVTESRLN